MTKPKRLLKEPSPKQVEQALSDAAAMATIHSHKPTWEDYVAEGVLDHAPEPGPDGVAEAKVEGHDRVVRMLKMNERFRNLESDLGDKTFSRIPKAKIRGVGGQIQHVPEREAERRERKHFHPRTSIMVPALPWKQGPDEDEEGPDETV